LIELLLSCFFELEEIAGSGVWGRVVVEITVLSSLWRTYLLMGLPAFLNQKKLLGLVWGGGLGR
jgi:hypothetical protein